MCLYKIIAVSNRKLCKRNLVDQIQLISKKSNAKMFILREKDLSEEEYESLAKDIINKCKKHDIECFLHSYIDLAIKLKHKNIHLPFKNFIENEGNLKTFYKIGVSIHSLEEAKIAEEKGATYVTAGHIFKTDCKKGLEPRGLNFLKEICENVNIPVYAIGGIKKENINKVIEVGAKGACIMSGMMKL